jgi:hypothetical protein
MTDDSIALRELLEKSADADLLREMIGFAAERLMELEVQGLTGAGYGERLPDRLVQRNGYRDRDWATRAGTVEPQAQEGQLLPRLSGAAPGGREGARGGDPGGARARHLDPLGRRAGQGARHGRHLQEPGQPPVR